MTAARAILRVAGVAMRSLILWALVALVFWVAVGLIPGFDLPSFRAALLTTGLVALFNALLWPLLIRIVLPLTVITFGLGSLALNAGLVALAIKLVDGTAPPFLGAIVAAILLSASLMLLAPALSFDDDARQLRIVRRRARRVREENRTAVPGVILFERAMLGLPLVRYGFHTGDGGISRLVDICESASPSTFSSPATRSTPTKPCGAIS
jgi:putative membrane protein